MLDPNLSGPSDGPGAGSNGAAAYTGPMLAVIWTFWIGVILTIASIGAILGLILGYIVKVKRIQYPRDN